MKNQKKWKITSSWLGAGLTALLLFLFSALSSDSATIINKAFAGIGTAFVNTLFAKDITLTDGMITSAGLVLAVCGYALFAFLVWNALRFTKLSKHSALLWSSIVSVVYAVTDIFHRFFVPGRHPTMGDFLFDCLGILLVLLSIVVCRWLWLNCPRVFNQETISYIIFGVLTTLVNLIAFGILYTNYSINSVISNTIAWVAAVLFAYVVNKLFVFHSHNDTKLQALKEFALFIAARLFSLGVDDLGIFILIDIMHINSGVAKILTNVIVMILNYFFSKLIIFKNTKPVKE